MPVTTVDMASDKPGCEVAAETDGIRRVSGGVGTSGFAINVTDSHPVGSNNSTNPGGWFAGFFNTAGAANNATVYALCEAGKLAFTRVSTHAIRIAEADLVAYLGRQRALSACTRRGVPRR